ncbi:hypothetical protein EPN81_02700 [Patescibacteria group bacterium]|nr:MAG: hypothetical protein EPN81_02700 [Patescibacteria group bacterium]
MSNTTAVARLHRDLRRLAGLLLPEMFIPVGAIQYLGRPRFQFREEAFTRALHSLRMQDHLLDGPVRVHLGRRVQFYRIRNPILPSVGDDPEEGNVSSLLKLAQHIRAGAVLEIEMEMREHELLRKVRIHTNPISPYNEKIMCQRLTWLKNLAVLQEDNQGVIPYRASLCAMETAGESGLTASARSRRRTTLRQMGWITNIIGTGYHKTYYNWQLTEQGVAILGAHPEITPCINVGEIRTLLELKAS